MDTQEIDIIFTNSSISYKVGKDELSSIVFNGPEVMLTFKDGSFNIYYGLPYVYRRYRSE